MTDKQRYVTEYYNKFANIYDVISSDLYYRSPRKFAVDRLNIAKNQNILNVPCGTGQNFKYLNEYLQSTGSIIGVDLSPGMLAKAQKKLNKNKIQNCQLFEMDILSMTPALFKENFPDIRISSILCDLGLSGFPDWHKAISNLLGILDSGGRLVVMDWYIEKPSLRAKYISYFGKGGVDRQIWQYLEPKLTNFEVHNHFKNGDMFVAAGEKI